MAKAKKLPSGSWRVLAYTGKDAEGKRQYKSFTADTKKEAEFAASEYLMSAKKPVSVDSITFDAAADKYIDSKSNLLSPSTIRGYRIMQRNAFPLLKDKPLKKIYESDIIQKQMNDNAPKYSAKSVANQFGFITAVMGHFKLSVDKVTLKAKGDKRILVPTKADAEKIMTVVKDAPDIECHVLLALTCSLRQSEIFAITAEDIEGEAIYIHESRIPDENNKYVTKDTTKSTAGTRTVIMPQRLSALMAQRQAQVKTGQIFTSTPGWVLKKFKRLMMQHGMPPYTIHSLRHCFAAIMHAQNVPDKYVMEMGGWATDNVLKSVYQYTFEDEAAMAKQKANSYFDGIMQHEKQHE